MTPNSEQSESESLIGSRAGGARLPAGVTIDNHR